MEPLNVFQPTTLDEVKELLTNYDHVKLLAGGTDLVLGLRREEVSVKYLIDLDRIKNLKDIDESTDKVTLGSMITFSQLKDNEIIANYYPSLINCAKNMGSPQIRNSATIGGNIINAGAAADFIPCLMSLNGILIFESKMGIRKLSCETYFQNYSKEKIKEDEILTSIIIPKTNGQNGYYKLGKRNSLAIARISAAVSVEFDNDAIKSLAVSLGAVGRFPFRVKELEEIAENKNKEWLSSNEALDILENVVYESIKGRKSMPFKKEAIKGVYKLALKEALRVEMSV